VEQGWIVLSEEGSKGTLEDESGQSTVRTEFFTSGRHSVDVRYPEGGCHTSIGAVTVNFDEGLHQWTGDDADAWGVWDNCQHGSFSENSGGQYCLNAGDLVTVNIDMDEKLITWEINGSPLDGLSVSGDDKIPDSGVAVGASLWTHNCWVQIEGYERCAYSWADLVSVQLVPQHTN
jgi:hypothetical protein